MERNGHHFIDGFNGRPKAEAYRFLEAHPDLDADIAHGPRLAIRDGMLELASLDATLEPDATTMAPMPPADGPG